MSLANYFTMQDAINALEKEVVNLKAKVKHLDSDNRKLRHKVTKLNNPQTQSLAP